MDIICMDTLTGENLSSFLVANMDLIKWSVVYSSTREGYKVKGASWGYRYCIQQ